MNLPLVVVEVDAGKVSGSRSEECKEDLLKSSVIYEVS